MNFREDDQYREGNVRIPAGCAISGFINRSGKLVSGEAIINSIEIMHERSNGLGGGFAGYGIYPQYKELYALHIFYENAKAKEECEAFLGRHFEIENHSEISTKKHPKINDAPLIWRYFCAPIHNKLTEKQLDEREYVVRCVLKINQRIDGAYVFSSGKNMGVFKALGYPEDVGRFYNLESYEGYAWTAHGRYPTNTPGWWGGAHPFALLDYTIVHNGEISSYDANRRFIEMYGYNCHLLTDTEVITYIFDYLNRKRGLPLEEISKIIAAPFWEHLDRMPKVEREKIEAYRRVYSSLLITGPFSIILGFEGGLLAMNDRLKLRSMVTGEYEDTVYFASEECAIRQICPDAKGVRAVGGGEPIIAKLYEGVRA